MRTQAELFRIEKCEYYQENGFSGERFKADPPEAVHHRDSNELSTGYVFPDKSVLWIDTPNPVSQIFTTRN